MEFKAEYRSYTTRYFGGPGVFLMIIFGIFLESLSRGFSFSDFINRAYSTADFGSVIDIVGFLLILQTIGYFSTNKNTKILKLNPDHLIFQFFNGKTLTLKYSEIESLEYTQDIFKNFEFLLKSGEKKMIYSTIKEPQRAFDLIRQKIEESNK